MTVNARPVMRFLLYAREYPGSVAASVDTLLGALTCTEPLGAIQSARTEWLPM